MGILASTRDHSHIKRTQPTQDSRVHQDSDSSKEHLVTQISDFDPTSLNRATRDKFFKVLRGINSTQRIKIYPPKFLFYKNLGGLIFSRLDF